MQRRERAKTRTDLFGGGDADADADGRRAVATVVLSRVVIKSVAVQIYVLALQQFKPQFHAFLPV